jgi:hypothetical protein
MNEHAGKTTVEEVEICNCTNSQLEGGETCALAVCPNAPGRRRMGLHPRLDDRGKANCATAAVLGRWDARALALLAEHPRFDRREFAWVGSEHLGGGVFCVSIYTGPAAESPYLWITEGEEDPERFLLCLYVGGADGEEAEDPFLVSECGTDDLAAESLRMIASARSPVEPAAEIS